MRIGLVRGLVASLLLLPGISLALGLGDVHLNSPLNAPLDAEIELVNATPEDLATLDAKLASKETFARYGLEWPPFMASITVTRDRSASGAQVLRISRRRPSPNPSSPCSSKRRGRVAAWCANTPCCSIRRCSRRTRVAAAPVPAPAVDCQREPPARLPVRRPRHSPRRLPIPQYAPVGGGDSYEVQRGDSLSAIARRLSASTRCAHRPADGFHLPQQLRGVRRRHESPACRRGVAYSERQRNRRRVAVRSARRDQPLRRLVGRIRQRRPRRPPAPGAAQRVCRERRLGHRQFRRSDRSCRVACATSKVSSTNPSACSSCATPNLPTCRPSWPLRSRPRRSLRRRPGRTADCDARTCRQRRLKPATPEATATPEAVAPTPEPAPTPSETAPEAPAEPTRADSDETAAEPSLLDSLLGYWQWALGARGDRSRCSCCSSNPAASARVPNSTIGWAAWPSRVATG